MTVREEAYGLIDSLPEDSVRAVNRPQSDSHQIAGSVSCPVC